MAALIVLPVGLGYLFFRRADVKGAYVFFTGFFAELALYEVLYLVLLAMDARYTTLITIFFAVSLPLAVLGLLRRGKHGPIQLPRLGPSRKTLIYALPAFAFILFQIVKVSLGMTVVNTDDARYIMDALVAIKENSVRSYTALSGAAISFEAVKEYSLSPWPRFWGMFAYVLNVHPATLMRSWLPFFLLPLFYGVFFLIFSELFEDDKEKVWLSMLLICIFEFFTAQTDCIRQWWPMNAPWYGKSFAPSILCPMEILLFKKYEDSEDREIKRKLLLAMFLGSAACCAVAATGVVLLCVLFACWGAVYIVRKKDFAFLPRIFAVALPCLAMCVALYVL